MACCGVTAKKVHPKKAHVKKVTPKKPPHSGTAKKPSALSKKLSKIDTAKARAAAKKKAHGTPCRCGKKTTTRKK